MKRLKRMYERFAIWVNHLQGWGPYNYKLFRTSPNKEK